MKYDMLATRYAKPSKTVQLSGKNKDSLLTPIPQTIAPSIAATFTTSSLLALHARSPILLSGCLLGVSIPIHETLKEDHSDKRAISHLYALLTLHSSLLKQSNGAIPTLLHSLLCQELRLILDARQWYI